jgi:uncharacterized protein YbaP (TraB family)
LLRLLCFVALLALGCSRRAESVAPPPAAPLSAVQGPGSATPAQHVLLWRAQLGPSTLHFLGSVHVARAELYPLDPRIEAAFAASDVLVLELELNQATQLQAAQRMLELGQLPPGVKLRDVVQPATWQLLEQAEQRRGLNLFGLRGFKPWFVALALTTQALEKEGFSADQGIDEHFRKAADGRLRIEALETVEEQMSLFTGLAPDAAELLLRQTLEEIDHYGEELDASFALWKTGDAAQLDELLLGPLRTTYPALFTKLFAERNQRMLARLTRLAEKPGHYFVVVGAGHLVGAGGIVDLLRAQGIVAQQL